MLIYSSTAKNLKARFYQEGETMELRIPLGKRRTNLVRRVIDLSNGKGNLLAGELAIVALSILDEIPRRESEHIANFALDHGGDYQEILEILQRFEKEGWINNSWRRDILQEIKDRLADLDAEWARGILRAHGDVESPTEAPKVAA